MQLKTTNFRKYKLLLIFTLISCGCTYWHKVNLKFLFPENYEGIVIIAWDEENGAEKVMEDDYEVYTIPKSGILKTKVPSRSLDPMDEKFYSYNDKTKRRTELEVIYLSSIGDTVRITKKNQYYQVGLMSSGHNQKGNLIFFLTRDIKSKFMDRAYREKYIAEHEEELYSTK
ncbi:hypothetical protein SAMN06265348_101122 [Pedobacter westerhofensis]|uniref:DUF6843 domain-containing protein n=1 Tax=Pedobacter westerhofensis TaxID=425512 RepID=A0A521AF08_9SPHI|nr:hypothetical protein SAMN06265348_101122 [Pedobacter westerhofensis]